MPAQHLLRLTNVTRHVRGRTGALLDSVSLTIDAGERIGLVGPSGSGKSSLLRAIARLDRWEQGAVEFCGKVVARDAIPGFRRQVIYLPQRPSLWPGSVRMNLQAPFAFASSQSQYDESVAIQWLEAFDKPSAVLDQSADSLSGGEQQIVALIRAMLLDPILLLLDEPSASLDPEATRRMEGLVLAWQQPGSPVSEQSVPKQSGSEPEQSGPEHARALVWTSHNADQISRVATRVVRIDHGALRQEGEA